MTLAVKSILSNNPSSDKVKYMQKRLIKSPFIFVFLLFALLLIGCEKQGKMEEIGESIDEMVENTGDKMEDISDEVKKKAKEAKEAVAD